MISLIKRLLSLSLFFLSLHSYAFQEIEQEVLERVQNIFEKNVQENDFSGTVLVAKAGEILFHQSSGTLSLKSNDSIQNNSHYSIASITKLFTSIRILQLKEAGKIDLFQSLDHYLPKLNIPNASKITPHHLLLHISGLANEKDFMYRQMMAPPEIIQASFKHKAPAKRGRFNYNNIDYMILGLLIEKISKQSWQEEITQHILKPLGLENTGFLAFENYPSNFAYPYSFGKDGLPQADPLFYIENFYAAAAMYSNSLDLLKLNRALHNGQVLNKESYALLAKSYPEYNYTGYGVWNYRYPFIESKPLVMERRGGILGANVVLLGLPETGHSIIILSNNNRFNPDSFGDEHNFREALIRALFKHPRKK